VSQSSNPSWQPWEGKANGVPQPWGGYGGPSLLASHADRERAVDVLRAGYGEGRMERTEFEQRVARVYTARTVGELALLVADLPQGPVAQPAAGADVPRTFLAAARPRTNGKAVAAAVCGLLCLPTMGLTGIPAVVLGHAARSEIRRADDIGDGLALIGLVLGWMSVAGWALVVGLAGLLAVLAGPG